MAMSLSPMRMLILRKGNVALSNLRVRGHIPHTLTFDIFLHSGIDERKQEHLDRMTDRVETVPLGEQFAVTEPMAEGLRRCEWPGRGQRVQRPGVTYYLDGAHTPSSIEVSEKL